MSTARAANCQNLPNVVMLKAILKNFGILFQSKDRKKDLVEHLAAFVQKCPCFEGSE